MRLEDDDAFPFGAKKAFFSAGKIAVSFREGKMVSMIYFHQPEFLFVTKFVTKTNMASRKETCLPTIHFQVLY